MLFILSYRLQYIPSIIDYYSTTVCGWIKVKNWVYIVDIPRTITSYCPVDTDKKHPKLLTRPVARGGSVGADEPPSEIKGPLF